MNIERRPFLRLAGGSLVTLGWWMYAGYPGLEAWTTAKPERFQFDLPDGYQLVRFRNFDRLKDLTDATGMTVYEIMELNGYPSSRDIKAGDLLLIKAGSTSKLQIVNENSPEATVSLEHRAVPNPDLATGMDFSKQELAIINVLARESKAALTSMFGPPQLRGLALIHRPTTIQQNSLQENPATRGGTASVTQVCTANEGHDSSMGVTACVYDGSDPRARVRVYLPMSPSDPSFEYLKAESGAIVALLAYARRQANYVQHELGHNWLVGTDFRGIFDQHKVIYAAGMLAEQARLDPGRWVGKTFLQGDRIFQHNLEYYLLQQSPTCLRTVVEKITAADGHHTPNQVADWMNNANPWFKKWKAEFEKPLSMPLTPPEGRRFVWDERPDSDHGNLVTWAIPIWALRFSNGSEQTQSTIPLIPDPWEPTRTDPKTGFKLYKSWYILNDLPYPNFPNNASALPIYSRDNPPTQGRNAFSPTNHLSKPIGHWE